MADKCSYTRINAHRQTGWIDTCLTSTGQNTHLYTLLMKYTQKPQYINNIHLQTHTPTHIVLRLSKVDVTLPVASPPNTHSNTRHYALDHCDCSLAHCSKDEGLQLAGAGSLLTLISTPHPPPSLSLSILLSPSDRRALLSQLIEPLPPPTATDRPCHCCSAKVRAWQLKLPTGGRGGEGTVGKWRMGTVAALH